VSGRPAWIVGVAAAIVLAYITFNTIRTPSQGGAGLPAGASLPPFAAQLATSPDRRDFDANVQPAAGGGHRAACDVRGAGVVNSCALAERGPVVLAFLIVPSKRCEEQMSVIDRLRARFPSVGFAGVAIRGSRPDIRAAVARGGWTLPIAWDRDGAVANEYAVSVCPTLILARRGGRVVKSLVGVRDAGALEREFAALTRSP
jgi:hypothetical protein